MPYGETEYASPETTPKRVERVRDVFPGSIDGMGHTIAEVLAKRETFALYLVQKPQDGCRHSGPAVDLSKVLIQYADDPAEAQKQAAKLNGLLCLRARLQYLADDLPCQRYYTEQTVAALRCALEGDSETAKSALSQEIENAKQDRDRKGRCLYLVSASGVAAVSAFTLMLIGGLVRGGAAPSGALLMSAGGGAIGAMLSIAIAIKSRTVAPDREWKTNLIDGGLRIGIGVIAGFALHLLLSTGIGLPSLNLEGVNATVGHSVDRLSSISLGFLAGFLERMVPDLLDKQSSK